VKKDKKIHTYNNILRNVQGAQTELVAPSGNLCVTMQPPTASGIARKDRLSRWFVQGTGLNCRMHNAEGTQPGKQVGGTI